jgi:hypothetical protein
MKAPFITYCKAFYKRHHTSVLLHCLIPVNEEQPTRLDVAGFITKRKTNSKGKNSFNQLLMDLQFIQHYKPQYLDLH